MDPDLKYAIVLVATPIATPFFLDYDLMIVAPAITWLAQKGLKEGIPSWQGTMLALLWLTPLVSRPIGACTGILLGPLVEAGVFASILVQVSRCLNAPAPSRPAVLCG
jgi:alpha-1,2-mannosyltransferase